MSIKNIEILLLILSVIVVVACTLTNGETSISSNSINTVSLSKTIDEEFEEDGDVQLPDLPN